MGSGRPVEVSLPRSVLRGYGLGSVATGSFGTVPGLPLNALLDLAAPHTREVLLTAVLDHLLRPSSP